MTPEEILRDLRDIHLPEEAADAVGAGLAVWPAALVVLIALGAGWLALRRRSAWRREIAGHLDRIEQDADDGRAKQGWTELAILLRRIAISLCDRRDVAGLVGDAWLKKLDDLFKTTIFSDGPGRGIVVFPYHDAAADNPERDEHVAQELKAATAAMRKRLPSLRMAK